jgi:arylsulfatase A-like enzyme
MTGVSGVAPYLLESLEGIRDLDWVRAQYAGEISAIDVQLGRLLSQLESGGLDENTIVMVVGDHGESLGENGVWFNHGGDLDASALAVPMIMRWPGKVPTGLRVKAPVGVVDVAPTLMAMLGVSFDAPDGLDLAPSLEGALLDRNGVASICYDRERNVEEREAGRIDRPTYLLGRVSTDTGFIEIGTHPGRGAVVKGVVSQAATQRCSQMLQALNPLIHERAEHRTEETLERLKALGYVE